jgi:hypothetical protein
MGAAAAPSRREGRSGVLAWDGRAVDVWRAATEQRIA